MDKMELSLLIKNYSDVLLFCCFYFITKKQDINKEIKSCIVRPQCRDYPADIRRWLNVSLALSTVYDDGPTLK